MSDRPRLAVLDVTLPEIEQDLALDEALLIEADEGRATGVLRFWEPQRYAVVLGASRRIAHDVNVDECRADSVPILRRSSGGGTVVIGPGVLNVTVVLPQSAVPGIAAVDVAQRFVLDPIARSLDDLVPGIEVQGSGDLVLEGRKFAGSAQRRLRNWFLVHLSILCDFALDRVRRYLREPDRQPVYRRGRSHDEFLRNLGQPRKIVRDAILPAWASERESARVVTILEDPLKSLLQERFANRSWIERF